MSDLLDLVPAASRARLRRAPQPGWRTPMLATLTARRFSDPGWIFERKLDGVRVLAFGEGRKVRLVSRNRKDLTGAYPEVAEALAAGTGHDLLVDGEVVAFEGKLTSFARLQGRMGLRDPERARATGIPVYLYAFDLLHLDGHDVTALPLRDRKRLLRAAIAFQDPLRFTVHRNERGEEFLEEACRRGWEGLIAKRADAPYVGARSGDWLKMKCVNEQEFVIGGWTDPRGSREELGALLIGYHEGGRLRFAGKVGTGYTEETLRHLGKELRRLERPDPPFSGDRGLPRKGAHWVQPRLVAQVGFTEWTGDGKLRHPRYLGLREDKVPEDVVRERPAR